MVCKYFLPLWSLFFLLLKRIPYFFFYWDITDILNSLPPPLFWLPVAYGSSWTRTKSKPQLWPEPQLWQHQMPNPLHQGWNPHLSSDPGLCRVNATCLTCCATAGTPTYPIKGYGSVVCFFGFVWPCRWHVEVPAPGLKAAPQPQSEPLQGRHRILNLLRQENCMIR